MVWKEQYTRWKSFLKKKKALVQITFEDAVTGVKTFAEPLLNADSGNKYRWNPEKGSWKQTVSSS